MVATDPFEKLDEKPTAKPKKISKKKKSTSSSTKKRKKSSSRPKTKVKQGSRLSAKWFFIGCGIFLLIFGALMIGGVFWVINQPSLLESLGMGIGQVKTLLYMFSSLFFGIVTIALLFWLFLSIYRVATRKSGRLKYILGLIASFILLIGIIVLRVFAINRISKLSSGQVVTTNPVLVYVETKDGPVFAEKGIPIIAPVKLSYKLNEQIYTSQIQKDIGQSSKLIGMTLDCGNGQTIALGSNNSFLGHCLYMEKKDYAMTMTVDYSTSNGEQQSKVYAAGGFAPQAVIDLNPLDDEGQLNDKKDEYIIGVAPVAVRFKSELLFTDLGLDDDNILRDFGADESIEYTNQASFQRNFAESKLHKVAYQLPDLPGRKDTRFEFDLRVIESELAGCQLSKENVRDNRWKIQPTFDEDLLVAEYKYTIYDTVNEEVVATPKPDAKGVLSYNFPEGAKYEVSMIYFTRDSEKGSCQPIEISEGYAGNVAEFTVYHRHQEDSPFDTIDTTSTQAIWDGESMSSSLVPSTFQVQVDRTVPDVDSTVEVYFNGRQIFPENNVYEFEINKEGSYDLEFVVTGKEGVASTQTYPVNVSRNSVEALIKIEELVGEAPFEVTLDASSSPLYDEEDEIVFFTRDFGDGELLNKVSQGKVKHTYVFDAENNKGEFYPKVTIQTRKGFEDSYQVTEPVIVKRKQKEIEIFMESHPTQQANVGDVVRMSVRTDGLVDSINWNFGNQRVNSCEDRSCSSTATTYTEPGEYEIVVEVSYEDNIPAVQRMKVRVF